MSQHPDEAVLFEYMNHALPGATEVQLHVSSCPECQTVISEFELLTSSYSATPLPQPAEKIITQALSYAEKKSRQKKPSWFGLPAHALAWGLLGVMVGMIALVIKPEFFMSDETPVAKQEYALPDRPMSKEVITVSDALPLAEPVVLKAGASGIPSKGLTVDDEERRAPSAELAFANQQELFEQALELKKQGEFAKAIQIFETLLSTDPNFSQKARLFFEWAETLAKLEKYAEALAKLNQLVQINPNYPGISELRLRLESP